jgi:divalent metal cation (Fe/Co/Zn/Cd) transporter
MAYQLVRQAMGELTEQSLPDDVEDEIIKIAESEEGVSGLHHLQTRKIGNEIAIDMHVRMPGEMSLYDSHQHATNIEHKLKDRFGEQTHVGLHVEPVKIEGSYKKPD